MEGGEATWMALFLAQKKEEYWRTHLEKDCKRLGKERRMYTGGGGQA